MRYEYDGNIGVLYSPSFGAGWSTWNCDHAEILMFHPLLVEPVHKYQMAQITKDQMVKDVGFALQMLGLELVCDLGLPDLAIAWMKPGTAFFIEEYDGNESFRYPGDIEWSIA